MRRILAIIFLLSVVLHGRQTLPVFLADNHAESFAWITRTFDLDERFHFVLIDAHSDASMAEKSEEIREQLRRVPSAQVRADRVDQWRISGRIQAYNWIEPLVPRPLDHILWIAKPELTAKEVATLTNEAVSFLDGRMEVEPRSSGSFAKRWQTRDIKGFFEWNPDIHPVILSIDLDFFAGMSPADREERFESIWKRAMDWPGLAGVSISVSRPWLANDAEADALVMLACSAVSRTHGALLQIDATMDDQPDDSKQSRLSNNESPRWDAMRASPALQALWRVMGGSLDIRDRVRDVSGLISEPLPAIKPDTGEIDCDRVWRMRLEDAPVLRIAPPHGATGRVRWFALEPARVAYDFLPHTRLGKDFSKSPGRWIYEVRRNLGTTNDYALSAEKWSPGKAGRVRLGAEVETKDGWLPVAPIELRLTQGAGFHAALSECFGMPYAFGIAGMFAGELTAVETGMGSDCSNLLIHAWRRNGVPLEWGDPGRLRAQLDALAESVTISDHVAIPAEVMERGVAIDFGRHVAALWEDRPPLGVIDGSDLVMHHLGGFPEIVTLDELANSRPVFALRAPRSTSPKVTIKIAGDVVLSGDDRVVNDDFQKDGASLFLANLEGIPSAHSPSQPPRHDFRFPAARLEWLKGRGIDAVSLANNHAGDAGPDGLLDGLKKIHASGIGTFGAGKNDTAACKPWRMTVDGIRIAVFGVALVDSLIAGPRKPGVAHLPTHLDLMDNQLRKSRQAGEIIIVLVHGGDEYRSAVNDDQRHWARWFVRRGARIIAGAHPHVIQRTEHLGGAVIAHSLGNAVYPRELKGADSGHVLTWRLNPYTTPTASRSIR